MNFSIFSKAIFAGAIAVGLSSPTLADQVEDFRAATSVSQITKLGAKQMGGASIQKIFAGHTLKNSGWTWKIKKNGDQSSKATDGSWSDEGTWEVRGNQFCRQSGECPIFCV